MVEARLVRNLIHGGEDMAKNETVKHCNESWNGMTEEVSLSRLSSARVTSLPTDHW